MCKLKDHVYTVNTYFAFVLHEHEQDTTGVTN
jgi:hypothetical protein